MPRSGRRGSVRRTLLAAVLAAVAATWLATAVVSYFDARHELDELLDAHLAQSASLLVAQAGRESEAIELEHSPQLHPYERRVVFQFWENGTVLRLHSASAPNARLSPQAEGFSDVTIDGRAWRVFSGWDADRRYLVQVGERRAARAEIVAKIAKNLLWPLAVALPALGLLVWLSIDRALRPLRSMSGEVERRAPDNLAVLDVAGVPAEVVPLVDNLNRLFRRVRASIENERRFTADAAHELRTPLTGVKLQFQLLERAQSAEDRQRAIDQLKDGIDRAIRLVQQLLTLARLEPEAIAAAPARVDLAMLVARVVEDFHAHARAKDIRLSLLRADPAVVVGDEDQLRTLLNNLVDNAIRYTPEAGAVGVDLRTQAGEAVLEIADTGPGIPVEDRQRVFDRFYRVEGSSAPGSGLGLSIVQRVATAHSAQVELDDAPGQGLLVRLRFPLPERP